MAVLSGCAVVVVGCGGGGRFVEPGVEAPAQATAFDLFSPLQWTDESIEAFAQDLESADVRVDRACLAELLRATPLAAMAPEADPESPLYQGLVACMTNADGTPLTTSGP